jgi:dihydrofolate synthase / folylpolyglutamate synthase
MLIKPIKTKLINPKDDLIEIIKEVLPIISENSILAITSKVVSLMQNRIIPIESTDHDELVAKEAEQFLTRDLVPQNLIMHTIKNNTLIGSSGIDRSSRLKSYILWPENPNESAQKIHQALTQHYQIKNLGIILTDSHSIPLRRGTVGISIGHFGFAPLKDYRKDHQNLPAIILSNTADGLAAAAVVTMGEATEQTPLALITDVPFVTFGQQKSSNQKFSSFIVPIDEDLFKPFFDNLPWHKGKT